MIVFLLRLLVACWRSVLRFRVLGREVEEDGGVGAELVRVSVLLIMLAKLMWLMISSILLWLCEILGGWLLSAPMPASVMALLVCLLCVPGGE